MLMNLSPVSYSLVSTAALPRLKQYTTAQLNATQYTAAKSNALQHRIMQNITTQYAATHCSSLRKPPSWPSC